MKNNKGFTLVELLAVIVVLGLVLTIVIRSVIVSMDNAKKETEKVFVSKLEDAIEQYIDLNKRDFLIDTAGETKKIDKVISSDGKKTKCVNVYQIKHKDINTGNYIDLKFSDIINDETGFIKESDLVNPANEDVECNKDAIINIYRDTDFVYYYQTDLDCIDTKDENGQDTNDIDTLPELKTECSKQIGE